MLDKKQIEKAFEEYMNCVIENEELIINNGYIEYTQAWWNQELMEWALDGYTTPELIYLNELFKNYEFEREEEIEECVYQKDCPIDDDRYEEYEVVGYEYTTYPMKRIA